MNNRDSEDSGVERESGWDESMWDSTDSETGGL